MKLINNNIFSNKVPSLVDTIYQMDFKRLYKEGAIWAYDPISNIHVHAWVDEWGYMELSIYYRWEIDYNRYGHKYDYDSLGYFYTKDPLQSYHEPFLKAQIVEALGLNEDYDGIGMLLQQVFPKEALGHGPADSNNALKRDLQRKLASVYDCPSIANYIDNPANAANIEALSEAMKNKVRVVLKGYASAHGDETRDRVVEPFSFTANMIDVWAYDVEKADCRMYSG